MKKLNISRQIIVKLKFVAGRLCGFIRKIIQGTEYTGKISQHPIAGYGVLQLPKITPNR